MRLRVLLFVLAWPLGVWAQQCTQAQLNTEFMTDPTARAYVDCASDGDLTGVNVNDVCVQDKLNAPCTGNPACRVDQTVTRETIWAVIDPTELETLMRSTQANDVARKSTLDAMMHNTTFNMGDADVRQKWSNVFTGPGSPITNAAILALQQKDVPRCDIVCKKGSGCTINDVSCGLRGDACP